MKKAVIITIHLGVNFGSILQTIATCTIVEKIGLSTVVVNYIPDRVTNKRYWKEATKSPIKFIRKVLAYPNKMMNKHLYNGFLTRYSNVSKAIYRNDDFVKLCPKSDFYISGSDQIWNSKHNEFFDSH